ncbi:MAG: putative FMN-dependent luciferase-like monooxygenase, partial [Microbacterium gubbeenense]
DGAAARVLASRTAVVVDSDRDRTQLIEASRAQLERTARSTVRIDPDGMSLDALVRATDTHVGTVDEVVESLSADRAIAASTDVSFQVHSLRADHETTLRSIELLAGVVAPHVGYGLTSDARAT